ncbi:MAG: hypothetical protein AB7P31_15170 [Steroidobacteraceae bacterium]
MHANLYTVTRNGREIVEELGKMTADEVGQVAARIRAEALQGLDQATRQVIALECFAAALRKAA